MLSIKDVKILEELDTDNLIWKVNTWFNSKEAEKVSFYAMMNNVLLENPTSLEAFKQVLDKYGIAYRPFVQFAMDNVDGTQEYDQLYVMKKIVDNLKNNKSLKWEI